MLSNTISHTQLKVFILSFLCVVAAHASREGWYMVTFPQVKSDLQLEMGFNSTFLGAIDTTFLFLYAMGFFCSGILADKFKPISILALGMSIGMLAFWCVKYNQISALGIFAITNHSLYLILWAIEGPAHGCIITTTVAVMGNWFPAAVRGKIMGIWGSNASVGNIVGEWVTAFVHEEMHLPWQAVILTLGTFLGCMGVSIRMLIEDKPINSALDPLLPKHSSISFWQAWLEPGVFLCAMGYSCVKLLNYGFLMWLPFYLKTSYGMQLTTIGFLATLYDLGAITGSILAGYISDKIKFRSLVVEIMVLLSVPIVFCFKILDKQTVWLFYIIVPLAGYMIGGSANIISTAVAADLSIDNETKESRATIIGIINGTGSLGAAFGQILVIHKQIGWLQGFSWNYVFTFLVSKANIGITLAASLLMLPIVLKERQKRRTE